MTFINYKYEATIMSGYFDNFTNLYKVNKTLRFELKPIGKTAEIVKEKIKNDEERAKAYKIVKPLIDNYHIKFIDDVLNSLRENAELKDKIMKYSEILLKENCEEKRKELFEISQSIREYIHSAFKGNDNYEKLFGKELIKDVLPTCEGLTEEQKKAIAQFSKFSTYFLDFQSNRENMYSEENQNTAIAHRIVDENLPMFIYNVKNYCDVKKCLSEELSEFNEQFSDILGGVKLDDLFQIINYSRFLTQKDIENYNAIVGDIVSSNGGRKGLNQRINEYNQKHKTKLKKFRQLYKQILSERKSLSWIPDKFENDKVLTDSITETYNRVKLEIERLINICKDLNEYDIEGIYIKSKKLDVLSKEALGNWQIVSKALETRYRKDNPIGRRAQETYEKEIDKFCKGVFSIKYLNEVLSEFIGKSIDLTSFFADSVISKADKFNKALGDAKSVLKKDFSNKPLSESEQDVETIKNFLDNLKEMQKQINFFATSDFDGKCDESFVSDVLEIAEKLSIITPLYNKVRNRLTERPNNDKKFKLKFDYPTLLNGWDKNKEKDNKCVILRDNGNYYLAITDKTELLSSSSELSLDEFYEKMEYKYLPDPKKMLPKVALSQKGIAKYNPSQEILSNYKKGTHKTGNTFNLKSTHALIDYFKNVIRSNPDWNVFDFQFSETKDYKSLDDFYKEVIAQNYKLSFVKINKSIVQDLNQKGDLCLFQIYNKDFSNPPKPNERKSFGKPNLHTLYWKALFDQKNLDNVIYKLDGEAEAFFRPRVINDDRITHPKGQPIACKSIENKDKTKIFSYDIIKDKRYRSDKYYIHIPITINAKCGKASKFNDAVCSYIKEHQPKAIIGIDRGERNLLYISIIDFNGKILEQKSFNTIVNRYNGNEIKVNYHNLLDKKEKERQASRQSWKTIENIKYLKSGYLSAVIYEIANLMIKHNAILVMEDLNFGFKKGRFKIEKQVYQNFEKALINKLNCLITDKTKDINEPGGLLKPYQICDKFESFTKMGKQQGFIFYVDAGYTSKIDPVTGFVNFFDTSYKSVEASKEFFNNFSSIRFNKDRNYYEFVVDDYSLFNQRAKQGQSWVVCSNGERIKTEKRDNLFTSSTIDLNEAFDKLFNGFDKSKELKDQILAKTDAEFYRKLLSLFKLTVQLRNSNSKTDEDYIVSPVSNKGVFYDSRNFTEKDKLPCDADANGAYNIARKGLIILERISHNDKNLAISRDVWLNKAQE